MRKALLLTLLVSVLVVASAGTVRWTGGAGNNLWNFATNWDGNAVPSKDDDVVLNPVGGATITVSNPAVAKSISVGGGGFHQTLTLLSSLAVGSGGVKVISQGTLQLSGNNDLPLSSVGDVVVSAGGTMTFSSGDIKGPGQYVIDYGAYLEFSGSALKQLEAVDLTVHGTATIQPSTIQLTKGATFTNGGDVTAVGQITILSNDNSDASFYSYGNFSYNGAAPAAPLTFQLSTYFAADLDIVSGSVVLQGYFHSAATINLPSGTALTIQSGPELKTFKSISGSGSVNVNGIAEVDNGLAVSWVTIADSGSLTLNTSSSTKSLSVSGKLILTANTTFTATDVSVAAGTITGDGQLSASGNFEFAVSRTGNANSFVSARINIAGTGFITGSVFLLFADAGNLNIQKGATFALSSSGSFTRQTGNPVVTNNGDFSIRLAVGSTFKSSVDFVGVGNFTVTAGDITIEASKFNATQVNLGTYAILRLQNTQIVLGGVAGGGTFNASVAPSTDAVIGDVALSYFGLVSGTARVKSLKLTTLEIFNGILSVSNGTTNTANVFNFYGGTLSGNAKLVSTSFNVGGNIPQNLDTIIINTTRFSLRAGTPLGTFMSSNNAQINAAPPTIAHNTHA